jgi:predicted RNase H-like nuclease (RuvC/YqgF family)
MMPSGSIQIQQDKFARKWQDIANRLQTENVQLTVIVETLSDEVRSLRAKLAECGTTEEKKEEVQA